MLTESEIIGWCHGLFRQRKRSHRDAAMAKCLAEARQAIEARRYWQDAEDRDAWERASG